MKINARKVGKYYEVIVKDGNTVITSGLLDKKECEELAFQLDDCSEFIYPVEERTISTRLTRLV